MPGHLAGTGFFAVGEKLPSLTTSVAGYQRNRMVMATAIGCVRGDDCEREVMTKVTNGNFALLTEILGLRVPKFIVTGNGQPFHVSQRSSIVAMIATIKSAESVQKPVDGSNTYRQPQLNGFSSACPDDRLISLPLDEPS
jgi:hypothetical protein